MGLKRLLREWGEERSEFPTRDFKRQLAFGSAFRDVSKTSPQELGAILEPIIRPWVREELERTIISYLRPSLNQINSTGSRILQLHFEDKLPSTLFTGCSVQLGDSKLVKIVLRDASSKKIITSGSLSSIKVHVVVLDGDFNPDDREDWTKREFSNKTVREREGKRPLVTGTLLIPLREGVGYLEDITFTDNSSWIRSGRFRLGAKVQNIDNEESIREGISNAFKVKDHRAYKKHHPPLPLDEVWRLEKIGKDGASHKRLASYGVYTVKDFLRLFARDPYLLRNILGTKISNKAWNTIIRHAIGCLLDNDELYMYKADSFVLVFNSIYQVVGTMLDGQHYQSLDMLNIPQKRSVENLKQHVFKNLNDLVPLSDQSLIAGPLLLLSSQASSFCSPNLPLLDVNIPVDQDGAEMQMDSDQISFSPTDTCAVENTTQFQVSVGETSHGMEEFNSILSSNFACSGLPISGYGWDTDGSLGPAFLTDPLAVNGNFQVETPSLQDNGYLATPINQALGFVSSNFGICISKNGKSKASWCKIRAVIKWQMVKSSCQKKGKAAKFRF